MSPNYIGEQRKTGKFNKLSTVSKTVPIGHLRSESRSLEKKVAKERKKKKYKKLMDHFYRNLLYV